jgi:gas vesicle protein
MTNQKGMDPLKAGAIGAAVGAAAVVGIGAAAALSSEENRAMVGDKIEEIKEKLEDKGEEAYDAAKKAAEKTAEDMKKK